MTTATHGQQAHELTTALLAGQLAPHHRRNGARLGSGTYGHDAGDPESASAGGTFGGDSGGASRFFYVAKASSCERNAGLDALPLREGGMRSENSGQHITRRDGGAPGPRANHHPTVKPVSLCRWMVRLVTPPGGTVLDPFAGSGTTLIAATLEGFDSIGVEQDAEYVAIAEARCAWWAKHPDGTTLVKRLETEKERTAVEDAGQGSLFDLGPAADDTSRATGRRRP